MTVVHQFVPSYTGRSAIGTHTREVSGVLRGMGIETRTWVGEARDTAGEPTADYRDFAARPAEPGSWLLYQLSTGSEMAALLGRRTEPLIVNYHNITPASFVAPWEPLVVPEMVAGRAQLAELAPRCRLGLAVSAYNERELVGAGYRSTAVVPFLVDLDQLGRRADDATDRRLAAAKASGGADWLFVGRISPNKRQHDLIRALAVARRVHDPRARLWLVGGSSSHAYLTALRRFVTALGLDGAVTFTGSVPQPVLVSHYRAADVFVCLSEHEGFCVPVLEAMWHGLPVVAVSAAAVPETLAGAGLLLPGQDPARTAEAVHRVVSDSGLRDAMVAAGRARAAHFSIERTRRQLAGVLAELFAA